jgi:NlpC/P60 family
MVQGPGGSGTPTGENFLSLVTDQLGTPYVWGGAAPGGFDCSGLVKWAADQLGLTGFPRTSEGQWGAVQRIRADQLQPGDLIFMNFPGEAAPGHVVIYAGGDQIIQAPSTGQLVQRDSFTSGTAQQWGATIVGYGRIPGLDYSGEPVTTNLGKGGTTSGGGTTGQAGNVLSNILDALKLGAGFSGGPSLPDIPAAILSVAAPLVKIAEALDWFIHPDHWIRLFAGLAGTVLVFGGIWQMSHAGEGGG